MHTGRPRLVAWRCLWCVQESLGPVTWDALWSVCEAAGRAARLRAASPRVSTRPPLGSRVPCAAWHSLQRPGCACGVCISAHSKCAPAPRQSAGAAPAAELGYETACLRTPVPAAANDPHTSLDGRELSSEPGPSHPPASALTTVSVSQQPLAAGKRGGGAPPRAAMNPCRMIDSSTCRGGGVRWARQGSGGADGPSTAACSLSAATLAPSRAHVACTHTALVQPA